MEDKLPQDVCRAVALDLRARNLTHEEAGRQIGKSRTTVSNLLARKKMFSRHYADLFAETFGYSREFLLYGKGSLFPNDKVADSKQIGDEWAPDPKKLVTLLYSAVTFIRLSGNKNLTCAWMYFTKGQYNKFQYYLKLTQQETGEKYTMPDSIQRFVCDTANETINSAPLPLRKELRGSETDD